MHCHRLGRTTRWGTGARLAKLVGWLLLGSTLGCVTIGKAPAKPVLSNDPSAGPAACYSECTVLTGCQSKCGYAVQR